MCVPLYIYKYYKQNMSYKQHYSQRTVNFGLQKTLLDVAASIRKVQLDNNPNTTLRKAIDFFNKIKPLLYYFALLVACTTGIAYLLKSML